jgi:mediator of RNA polymerase II transcription subunit 17, fungi type
MATNTENVIPISLRPLPKQKHEFESLKSIAGRIHSKYGGFRHITEDELRSQMSESGPGVDMSTVGAEVGDAETNASQEKGSQEYIAANRMKMMQYLGVALNETLMLLDFTSLLESGYPVEAQRYDKLGASSMSAVLKQKVPAGSLAFDEWENMPEITDDKVADNLKIAIGGRMEALTSSVDTLLDSATRLEQDVKNETKYWEQVLAVQERGWTVFRSPIDRRHLGVQVASMEAGPLFKGQGLVQFETDSQGEVSVKHSSASEPKMVRVRIEEGSQIIGSSRLTVPPSIAGTEAPLHSQVLHARDSLFEEELFHEMVVETRALFSLGVHVRGQTIHVPISNSNDEVRSTTILVDLVSLEDMEDEMYSQRASDEFAQSVAISLRVLLSNLHRERLIRRTSRPAPLSDQKRPSPPSSIIRPLMKFIQHQTALLTIQTLLTDISRVMHSAGLSTTTQVSDMPQSSQVEASQRSISENKPSALDPMTVPAISAVEVYLPSSSDSESSQSKFTITIQTNLSKPPFTTNFSLLLPPLMVRILYEPSVWQPRRFEVPDTSTLYSMLGEIFALDIAHNILYTDHLAAFDSWTTVTRAAEIIRENDTEHVEAKASVELMLQTDESGVKLRLACRRPSQVTISEEWDGTKSSTEKRIVDIVEGFAKAFTNSDGSRSEST